MKLLALEIQQLPGIDAPLRIENFDPGSNLVLGPNAIGKSSLVRALELLLSVDPATDPKALSLVARFHHEDQAWTVSRTGSAVSWTRNGQPAEVPPLPRRDQLHCYWLSMEDLVRVDRQDESLVRELQQALAGGYDLKTLGEQAPFRVGPRLGMGEAGELTDAERALARVESRRETLRLQEAQLPGLEQALARAREAQGRIEPLEHAQKLVKARQKRESIAAELDQWPAAMKRLRGDETAVLAGLEEKRDKLRATRAAETLREDRARQALEATGLAREAPGKVFLDTLSDQLHTLAGVVENRKRLRAEHRQAAAGESTAREALGGGDGQVSLTPESVSRSETLARELHEARTRADSLARDSHVLVDDPEPHPGGQRETCREAVSALREWLAGQPRKPARVRSAAALAAVASLATGIGALAGELPWLAGGAVVALAGALWALWESAPGQAGGIARARYLRTGLAPPEEWKQGMVEARLAELEEELPRLEERIRALRQVETLRPALEQARLELAMLEEKRNRLAAQVGFDPELTAAGLDRFIRLSQALDQARNRRRGVEVELESIEQSIKDSRSAMASALAPWGCPTDDDTALKAVLADLRERRDDAEAARREMEDARGQLERTEASLREVDQERQSLFDGLGLGPDDKDKLIRLVEQRPAWEALSERLLEAQATEAGLEQFLSHHPELVEGARNRSPEVFLAEIRTSLESARAEAEPASGLDEEIRSTRQRLREAGKDLELESAAARVESARAALEDRQREALMAEAAGFLLEDIRAEYRSEHEPAALSHARNLFRRFTHGAFELALDDEHGLVAIDTRQEARRQLFELSSGTRMQLLLAVRLAWTRRLEQRTVALPLFLDEALTTSDEHRFAEVARSLESLTREEDRQVFYLSARRHERRLWQQATDHDPHVIDLANIRFGSTGEEEPDFTLPESDPLPTPDGRPPEAYARFLGVPPINAVSTAGGIHPFHLVRDNLDTLWDLMENWRITHLGSLESLLDAKAGEAAVSDKLFRDRLRQRCRIGRSWLELFRIGRGRPVGRGELEASGAVSGTFIDRAAELADEVGGNAEELLARMRDGAIPRFQSGKMDELEHWLEENGLIDPRPTPDPEARLHATLQSCAFFAEPEEIRTVVGWLEAAADS